MSLLNESDSTADGHTCFGCQRQIADMEPHIHVGLDEWAAVEGLEGLEGFGLDDLLTFAFCVGCTETKPGGRWHLEAHEIEEGT